jgi:hypothetical protein
MVIYNGNEKDKSIETGRYSERINGRLKCRNVITDDVLELSKLTIPSKATLVLELLPNNTP